MKLDTRAYAYKGLLSITTEIPKIKYFHEFSFLLLHCSNAPRNINEVTLSNLGVVLLGAIHQGRPAYLGKGVLEIQTPIVISIDIILSNPD